MSKELMVDCKVAVMVVTDCVVVMPMVNVEVLVDCKMLVVELIQSFNVK